MRHFLFLPLFAIGLVASAQTEVRQSAFTFSDGTHPTFVVTFIDTEPGDVESWYRSQLKDLAEDVSNKKEIRASGARVLEVALDTITILCKAEKAKKSPVTSLHLAFRVNGTFVAGASDKAMIDGASNFCYTKAVTYKKLVVQRQVTEAERTLVRLEEEQATLEKDKRRFEEGIEKNKEKGIDAGKEKVQTEADLRSNELAIDTKKSEVSTGPSDQNTEALQKLLKENERLKDRVERLGSQASDAEKKVKDLEENVRKNLSDQEAKKKAIEVQRKAVEGLRTVLANVN